MRLNGTRYDEITKLPTKAVPVSKWASDKGVTVGSVYMAFKRFKFGYVTKAGTQSKGSNPGYSINCYQGMNFVIPN